MISRLLKLQPAKVGSVVAVVYAAGAMLYRAFVTHEGVLDMDLLVAAAMALYGLYTSTVVTPLADPKDNDKTPLTPVGT